MLVGDSLEVDQSVITLGITYILSLVFALYTHRHLFRTQLNPEEQSGWGTKKALLVLFVSIALAIIIESDILIDNIKPIIENSELSQMFVGLVVIGIVGNIPELMTAVTFGIKNKITQLMEIGMHSATQIALFAITVLVFVAPLVGGELGLAFAPFLLAAMILAVMIINHLGSDGVCNWLEGVQLIAAYVIIAIAFYFI